MIRHGPERLLGAFLCTYGPSRHTYHGKYMRRLLDEHNDCPTCTISKNAGQSMPFTHFLVSLFGYSVMK